LNILQKIIFERDKGLGGRAGKGLGDFQKCLGINRLIFKKYIIFATKIL